MSLKVIRKFCKAGVNRERAGDKKKQKDEK
jgi:hypothetical protein